MSALWQPGSVPCLCHRLRSRPHHRRRCGGDGPRADRVPRRHRLVLLSLRRGLPPMTEWHRGSAVLAMNSEHGVARGIAEGLWVCGCFAVHPAVLTLETPRPDPVSWRIRTAHPRSKSSWRVTHTPTGLSLIVRPRRKDAKAVVETLYEEFPALPRRNLGAVRDPRKPQPRSFFNHPTWSSFAARITTLREQP